MDIGQENADVAETHVVGRPSRSGVKWVKNVDVYNTCSKLIIFMTSGAGGVNPTKSSPY